jgi:hypothetical protein
MQTRIFSFVTAFLLIFSAGSLAQTKTGVKKLQIMGSMDISLNQTGDVLTITSEEDAFLVTAMGSTLLLMNGSEETGSKTVAVSTTGLAEIEIGGTATLKKGENLKFGTLTLKIEGASDGPVNITCDNLTLVTSGSSTLQLTGSATTATIKSMGTSDIEAKEFIIQTATINMMGTATAWVNVKKSLKASITGTGNIYYKTYLVASKPKKKYLPAVSKKVIGVGVIKGY